MKPFPANTTKSIIVVRNPFLAYPSWFTFAQTKDHKKRLDSFDADIWAAFFEKNKNRGENFIRKWAANTTVHYVLYENLMSNLETELKGIAEFLNLDLNPERLRCTIENSEGKFKRDSGPKRKFPFTKSQTDVLMERLCNVHFMFRVKRRNLPLSIYEQNVKETFVGDKEHPLPKDYCVF